MSSIIRQVLQRFMKPTYIVGRDLQGNKYYEYPNANDGRPKRTVQYKDTDDMWSYIASGRRLPVQWSAWLTHTRSSPPTIEELQADLARQHRIQINAAILEARDKEECDRVARLVQHSPDVQAPELRLEKHPEQCRREGLADVRSDGATTPVRDPWAEAKRGSDEPQSWTPTVRRK